MIYIYIDSSTKLHLISHAKARYNYTGALTVPHTSAQNKKRHGIILELQRTVWYEP